MATSPVPPSALAPYRTPSTAKSLWQLGNTLTLFVATWIAMRMLLDLSYALVLGLALPAAFFLVRLFIIQHDCGHGSFLERRALADWIGRGIGLLTLTPYACWKRQHAIHHATSGNLDRRGMGDIATITVSEYRARSRWRRFTYRFYRNPFLIFGPGASIQFLVLHRLPNQVPKEWRRERQSVWLTNLAIVATLAVLGHWLGWRSVLLVQLPITVLACTIGVWLFYVQHQFARTYWEHEATWSYDDAALSGSSHLDLPRWLHWATGNIGFHHVHHLNPTIPNYRLAEALADHPELAASTRLGFREALACSRLALWDEERKRLVSFREAESGT